MKKDYAPRKHTPHECCCGCHGEVVVHVTTMCDCGKPVRPPRKPGCCPPPDLEPTPGTVNLPQDEPPFHAPTSDLPPWKEGKPPAGDPGEVPWFRGQIGTIQRKGPRFGPRKDEFLPYLLVRFASGDRGARPVVGAPFWESPDIYVVPDQEAATAPLMPATTGGIARANAPNTLYAHIWNLGKAPAYRVRVEFYGFNPSLGINYVDAPGASVGATYIDLENRFTLFPQWQVVDGPSGPYLSRGCHAIVRCPQTWFPGFVNNGHECLVVRAFEPFLDGLTDKNQFSAMADRHVAQRNIAVVPAASPATIDLALDLGYAEAPDEAEVDVILDAPNSMEWLQLYMQDRNISLTPPTTPVVAGLLPPAIAGARLPELKEVPFESRRSLLRPAERFHRGCDPLRIFFHASAQNLRAHQAQVLRVRQRVAGDVIGGYTVVLIRA
ncbi:MAG TPA: hypothetical protein VFA21_06715 [Pyrinomonadaceae bacterium]|nr:hypothetical protein [Pyrinomonadaceae bacterium]